MTEGSDINSTASPVLSFLHDGPLTSCDSHGSWGVIHRALMRR